MKRKLENSHDKKIRELDFKSKEQIETLRLGNEKMKMELHKLTNDRDHF